jgi:PTS system nitrogen regulatory IIA component
MYFNVIEWQILKNTARPPSTMYDEDEILTIREVARYLKMNERSIYKLAHQGLIPTVKIGNQWRFRKNLIDAWLESQMAVAAMKSLADSDAESPSISSLLKPEAINTDLAGRGKDEVLRELADLMVKAYGVKEKERFLREILNREKLCTTAVQTGVAVPHPRRNGNHFTQHPALAFGCSKKGIDFGSLDGELTFLFFMLCAPQDHLHLRIMARINRVLSSADVREELVGATSAERVIAILKREEGAIEDSQQYVPLLERGRV